MKIINKLRFTFFILAILSIPLWLWAAKDTDVFYLAIIISILTIPRIVDNAKKSIIIKNK